MQFGASSDLVTQFTESVIFLSSFFYTFLLGHSMDSTEIPLSIFQPRIHHKVYN